MHPRAWFSSLWPGVWLLGLAALMALAPSLPAKERCVPKSETEWLCGENVQASDGVKLSPPEAPATQTPLLLLDPSRFADEEEYSVNRELAAAAATESPEVKSDANSEPAPTRDQSDRPTPASPPAQLSDSASFVVQLARAHDPRGFSALVGRLGVAPALVRRVQLADQMWVLLYGNYPSLDAARAAIPHGASGAFARSLNSLNF